MGSREKRRTDSSHLVAAIRELSRLEMVGEILRTALNSLAVAAPEWLIQIAHPDWFDRYDKRVEEYRLPKDENERQELAKVIGRDGMILLNAIYSEDSPHWLRELPAVETLRRNWVHQYYVIEGQLHLRKEEDLPPASIRYESPYDTEVHFSAKRDIHWTGCKVHITEICDKDSPHIITNVETTIAPQPDVVMTAPIHEALSEKELLPSEHMVDAGYVNSELLVTSQTDYQIEMVGPINPDNNWQSQDENAYATDSFDIDWEAKTVICPQGKASRHWKPAKDRHGNDVIVIRSQSLNVVTVRVGHFAPAPRRSLAV